MKDDEIDNFLDWSVLKLNKIEGEDPFSSSTTHFNPNPMIDFTVVNHEGYCWMFGGYNATK